MADPFQNPKNLLNAQSLEEDNIGKVGWRMVEYNITENVLNVLKTS